MELEEFTKKYFLDKLSDSQLEAVKSVNGPVLLLAVPGSGKTTVLTYRLAYMIKCCGISPKNILTVTFTVASAKDMKRRYIERFGTDEEDSLTFKTINSFAALIMRIVGNKYPQLSRKLIASKEASMILTELYKKIYKDYPTEQDIEGIKNKIGYVKNMMILPSQAEYEVGKKSLFEALFNAYNKYLKETNQNDFDDQLILCYEYLSNFPSLLQVCHEKYKYILVDEAQDTSKIQNKILQLLAGEDENIFMVGDEDQSIYGFRGAYPEGLVDFKHTFPNGKVLYMEDNYRSTPQIACIADNLIARNKIRHEKHIYAANEAGTAVKGLVVKDASFQEKYLVAEAKKGINGSTAVLYRDNESAIPLINLLEKAQIPYSVKGNDSFFFKNKTILSLIRFLKYVIEPTAENFLAIYYNCGLYIKREDAEKIVEGSKGADHFNRLSKVLDGGKKKRAESLDKLFKSLANQEDRVRDGHKFEDSYSFPYYAASRIIYETGFLERVSDSGKENNKVSIFLRLADEENSITSFLERLEYLEKAVKAGRNDNDDFLLTTIHSAKGLEFDTVYCIDFFTGIFPKEDYGEEKTELEIQREQEEERRLCYVAITRAKKNLNFFLKGNKYCGAFISEIFKNQKYTVIENLDKFTT